MNDNTAKQFGTLSAKITISIIKAEIIAERPTATNFDKELIKILKEAMEAKNQLWEMVFRETHKGIKI